MKTSRPHERFVGVRLAEEDLARLDKVVEERGFSTRSEAIRHILREAGGRAPAAVPAPGPSSRGVEVAVPVSLFRELERSVENGYSSSVGAALEKALERGLEELAVRRPRRIAAERELAEALSKEEGERRRASQEGERRGGA